MYKYKYLVKITKRDNDVNFTAHNLIELSYKINEIYKMEISSPYKIQNYISGRSKYPVYLNNLSITRI